MTDFRQKLPVGQTSQVLLTLTKYPALQSTHLFGKVKGGAVGGLGSGGHRHPQGRIVRTQMLP